MMKTLRYQTPLALMSLAVLTFGLAGPAAAEFTVQCGPKWENFDADGPMPGGVGTGPNAVPDGAAGFDYPADLRCMNVSGSDGFAMMSDDAKTRLYVFSFGDLTGLVKEDYVGVGLLNANFPAPQIALDQGDEFYLNVTNVGMVLRPDLFDAHTVHYHGFPNASATFDGVPEMSFGINQESTLTYYYKNAEPGTYMWHCHVEATEHMQMGMLGSLWVRPAQNRLESQTFPGGFAHTNPDWCDPALATGTYGDCYDDALNGSKYVYNDRDGSSNYDVEFPIQMGSVDSVFHNASESVQPLPFADMRDDFVHINGRSYPDTVDTGVIFNGDTDTGYGPKPAQPINALITATVGQKILLRVVNLSVTREFTLQTVGLRWKVVGHDSRLLRGHGVTDLTETDLFYDTASLTVAGGETYDVIIDTAGVPAGTYVLYTTNMNYLSNSAEDFGGLMTEIRIN